MILDTPSKLLLVVCNVPKLMCCSDLGIDMWQLLPFSRGTVSITVSIFVKSICEHWLKLGPEREPLHEASGQCQLLWRPLGPRCPNRRSTSVAQNSQQLTDQVRGIAMSMLYGLDAYRLSLSTVLYPPARHTLATLSSQTTRSVAQTTHGRSGSWTAKLVSPPFHTQSALQA